MSRGSRATIRSVFPIRKSSFEPRYDVRFENGVKLHEREVTEGASASLEVRVCINCHRNLSYAIALRELQLLLRLDDCYKWSVTPLKDIESMICIAAYELPMRSVLHASKIFDDIFHKVVALCVVHFAETCVHDLFVR